MTDTTLGLSLDNGSLVSTKPILSLEDIFVNPPTSEQEMEGVLKAAQSTTPNIRPGPPVIYPTGIDLDLIILCLNEISQPSCADLFQFIHYFFAAKLNSDPFLAAYLVDLSLDPPNSNILTHTSTSTTSVRDRWNFSSSYLFLLTVFSFSLLVLLYRLHYVNR